MSQVPIALQLYTVRDEMSKDFAGTMHRVADIGYVGVELAGTGGLSAAALRALLAETGLRVMGSHVGLASFEREIDQVANFYSEIGARSVGVPALPGELRNPDGFRRAAAILNRAGEALSKAGIALYYHNHAFEFDVVDDQRGIDILLAETDPRLVRFECDVYWVYWAGEDPAQFIRTHSGRFPLVHLKDMAVADDRRTFAEVGEGVLDFEAIFSASEAQEVEWYVVEQDICNRPSLESARLSLDNLRKWGKA